MNHKHDSILVRLGWFCIGWLPCLAGAVALAAVCSNPAYGTIAVVVALPSGILLSWGAGVVLHEAGHLVAARLLRLNPYCLSLGSGHTLWVGSLLGLHCILKAVPFTGMVYVFPTPASNLRWRMLAMVAAGPAMNALMVWLCGSLYWSSSAWSRSASGQVAFPILCAAFLINGWLFVSSLVPHDSRIDGGTYPNDGLQILQLLRGTHLTVGPAFSFPEGTTHTGSTDGSTQQTEGSLQWQLFSESNRSVQALQQMQMMLCARSLPLPVRHQLLDTFATAVLMLNATTHLDEADRYSEELLRAKPNELTVKGTRGSVLIAKGELEEGTRLLTEVVERDPNRFDQAIAATYLGLAEIKREKRDAAAVWLVKAREFDPACVPLKRIERILAE